MSNYIIGIPFKASRGHYRRDDTYNPTGSSNSIMVASPDDLTPVYKHWSFDRLRMQQPGNRNPNCSCCYLGITHSEAKHKEAN